MRLFACAAAVTLLAAFAPNAVPAQTSPASTVSITLPGDLSFAFKPGAGVGSAQARCLTCHSSAYVSTQPVLNKVQWTAEVAKMRKLYGAQMTDDEAATVSDYLAATYGKP